MKTLLENSKFCKLIKQRKDWVVVIGPVYALLAFLIYYEVASAVFCFRHPWATSTEVLMHPIRVIKFDKVPYAEMRK